VRSAAKYVKLGETENAASIQRSWELVGEGRGKEVSETKRWNNTVNQNGLRKGTRTQELIEKGGWLDDPNAHCVEYDAILMAQHYASIRNKSVALSPM